MKIIYFFNYKGKLELVKYIYTDILGTRFFLRMWVITYCLPNTAIVIVGDQLMYFKRREYSNHESLN